MSEHGENFETLLEAGLIIGDLPAAHRQVIDDLTGNEVETLVEVYNRLAQADAAEGHAGIRGEHPAFVSFMVI